MDLELIRLQAGQHPKQVTFAAHRKLPSTSASSTSSIELPVEMCMLNSRLDKWEARLKSKDFYSLQGAIGSEGPDHFEDYKHICEWIENKFDMHTVVSNKEVPQFKNLKPIFSSMTILPDVAIYAGSPEVPLLLLEVHSSSYHQTLHKLVLVLIEHLRWLRNCDSSIVEWSGFCFPKRVERTCVSRVDISWDCHGFWFTVDFFPLESNEVEESIRRTIQKHLEMVEKETFLVPPGHLIGLPLGVEGEGVFGVGACQLPSSASIVVTHEDKVYKHILDPIEMLRLRDIMLSQHRDEYLLPTGIRFIGLHSFLVFPMLIFPMARGEAFQCLPEFVKSVAQAIHSMHQVLEMAHLDIRLENICFRCTGTAYTAVLIDLDRCQHITKKVSSLRYTVGVMYSAPEVWTCDKLDWRQFGYMVVHCIEDVDDYHNMTVPEDLERDNFISKLINEGEYNPCDLQNSIIHSRHGHLSLANVLKGRLTSSQRLQQPT